MDTELKISRISSLAKAGSGNEGNEGDEGNVVDDVASITLLVGNKVGVIEVDVEGIVEATLEGTLDGLFKAVFEVVWASILLFGLGNIVGNCDGLFVVTLLDGEGDSLIDGVAVVFSTGGDEVTLLTGVMEGDSDGKALGDVV